MMETDEFTYEGIKATRKSSDVRLQISSPSLILMDVSPGI